MTLVSTRDINVRADGKRSLNPVTMKSVVANKIKAAFKAIGLTEQEFRDMATTYNNLDIMERAIRRGDEGPKLRDAILEPWERKTVDRQTRTPIVTTHNMPNMEDYEDKQKRDAIQAERTAQKAEEAKFKEAGKKVAEVGKEQSDVEARMQKARAAKEAKKKEKME